MLKLILKQLQYLLTIYSDISTALEMSQKIVSKDSSCFINLNI